MSKNSKKGGEKKVDINEEKICFVVAPIGKEDSEDRRRSDQVFKHIIISAIEPLGYKPIRADHISEPGIITSQVIQHVVDSPLVIADLTGRNPNVFYELAIRHAIKRPLVQLIQIGEQIPFDVAGTRTIQIDIHDLDNVEKAKDELVKQVKTIEKGKVEIDTPISVALDLKILKGSTKPEERSLADVIEAVSELRSAMLSIEEKVKSPESLIPPDYLEYVFRQYTPMRSRAVTLRQRSYLVEATELLSKPRLSAKDKDEIKSMLRYFIRNMERDLYRRESHVRETL